MNPNKENTVFNVLSCFDGMSCGQVALQRAGIAYGNYFASEVDKYAIQITQKNHPNTIQLGTIENWREWNLPKIDLVIGGSPCQGFSNAGLGLNFDDPRSKLFFTYVDILFYLIDKNPKLLFLLENVKMKKEWRDIITDLMGVEPIEINSALVSAQNRKRLYWTNIPDIEQPEDRYTYLKDILEDNFEYVKTDKKFIPKQFQNKASTLTGGAHSGGNHSDMDILVKGAAMRGRYDENGKVVQQLEFNGMEKSNALTSVQKDSLVGLIQIGVVKEGYELTSRVYSGEGKSPTLLNRKSGGGYEAPKVLVRRNGHGFVPTEIKFVDKSDTLREATQHNYHIRKKSKTVRVGGSNSPVGSKQEWDLVSKEDYRRLSVVECERLQTLEDNYTEGVSNTQRYKMIGNGWTVDVIAHIFRNIRVAEPNE